jgi:hypothetical protein
MTEVSSCVATTKIGDFVKKRITVRIFYVWRIIASHGIPKTGKFEIY